MFYLGGFDMIKVFQSIYNGSKDLGQFSFEKVVDLHVPPEFDAAKFLVWGRVVMQNNDGDPQNATAEMTTADGNTILDKVDVRIPASDTNNNVFSPGALAVSLQGIFSLPCSDPESDQIVDIRCATFKGNAIEASLILMVVDDIQKTTDGENFSKWCNKF